jgi:translocation and assembly module TamB
LTRLWRIARRLLIGFGLIVLLVLAGGFLVLRTDTGRGWLTAEANALLADPDQRITLSGLTGALPFDARIGHIEIADRDGTWLTLDGAAVDLDPWALFHGVARIETLSVTKSAVLRQPSAPASPPPKPATPAADPLALPRLPLGIELDRIALARIDLAPTLFGETVDLAVAGTATLNQGAAAAQLTIDRIDGAAGHVALRLDYAGPERLGLELHFAEPSGALLARFLPAGGRRPFTLDLGGQGALAAWRGKLDFHAGADTWLTTELALGRSAADLTVALKGKAALAALLPEQFREAAGPGAAFDLTASVADAGPIGLDHLDLTLGAGTIHAAGRYDPQGGALAGRVEATGELAPLQALAGTALAGHAHLVASADGTIAAPNASLVIDGQDLAAADVGIKSLTAQINAAPLADRRFHVTGAGRVAGLTSGGTAAPAGLGDSIDWSSDLTAASDGSHIDITQAKLSGGGLDLAATGSLDGGKLLGHAHLAAADLARFAKLAGTALAGGLQLDAEATSPDGKSLEAKLTGRLDGFRSGVPAADAVLGHRVTLAASARRGTDGRLDVPDLKLTGEGVTLAATASLDPAGKAMQGHAVLDLPALAPLGPSLGTALAGRLGVTIDAGGAPADPALTVKLAGSNLAAGSAKLDRLDATIAAPSLARKAATVAAQFGTGKATGTLSAAVAQTGADAIDIKDLKLDGPATAVHGALALDLRSMLVSGTLDGEIGDLAAWSPITGADLAGHVSLAAKLTDQAGQGVDATLQTERLALGGGITLQHLRLAAHLADLLGSPRGTVDLDAAKLALSGTTIDTLRLQAEAKSAGAFGFTGKSAGKIEGKAFTVATAGRAALSGSGQDLNLTTLDGKFADLPFRLEQPLSASRKGASLALTGLSLDLGGGNLTGRAGSDGKSLDLALLGKKLPLTALARLGGQPAIAGTLGLDLALAGPLAGPRGRLVVTVPDLKISAESHPELPALALVASAEISPETIEFKGKIDGAKESAALGFLGSVPIAFSADGLMTLRQDGPLQAKLEGAGRLDALGELLPLGEDKMGGRIAIDLTVAGSPATPQAGGRLTLHDGTYDNDATGLTLRGLEVELDGDQQAFVLHRFDANDGGTGKLAAQGKVDLAPAAGPALDITATVSRFTAARGDDLTAVVDGKLQVTGALSAPRVTAAITMPRADINIPDQLPSSVPQLDVVRIDSSKPAVSRKPAAPPAPPVTATLDIHFHDPGQTFVRGRGLTSEWSGDLAVTGTSAEPVIIGEFDVVNGTFDALGKSFVLQRGVLRFDGSTLPLLDMLAQVQAADVTAQIVIQGSPTRPEIKLTSTPELPQDEVLSRVMFGSGVGQITPAQGLQLAQAAATLAGGGPSVLDRMRNYTGLDRLSVGDSTNATGTAAAGTTVSGGKYVAPGIFVGVDQGLSGASTRAKVEIELTPNITLNATAGAASDASSIGAQYKLDY